MEATDLAAVVAATAVVSRRVVLSSNGGESVRRVPLQQLSRQVRFSYVYCSPVGCGCLGFVGFLVRRGRICCVLSPSDFGACLRRQCFWWLEASSAAKFIFMDMVH